MARHPWQRLRDAAAVREWCSRVAIRVCNTYNPVAESNKLGGFRGWIRVSPNQPRSGRGLIIFELLHLSVFHDMF